MCKNCLCYCCVLFLLFCWFPLFKSFSSDCKKNEWLQKMEGGVGTCFREKGQYWTQNIIPIKIPIDYHAFEELRFKIISQLNVIIPSKESVQKYSPLKTFFNRFPNLATSLEKDCIKDVSVRVKEYYVGQLFSRLSLRGLFFF